MNIDLPSLAAQLGIAEYPEELVPIYERIRHQAPLCDIGEVLTRLHEEYAPFDRYFDNLMRGAEAIEKDEALLTWLTLGLAFCKDASEKDAARFPMPPANGDPAKDAFSAILIAMEYPETIKRYRERGFDESQIKKHLGNLGINLRVHELTQGRITLGGLFTWMTHYAKARIFDEMGFNFQPWKWGDEAILLKNRNDGELVFLLLKGKFTADGKVAGRRGAEEIPAVIEATVEETNDSFIGYRADGQRIRTERECFKKSEWEAVLRPNDDVINFHIPRGADLSPDHVAQSMKLGKALTERYYPECDFKQIVCISWMLDPKLLDILPTDSKISQFIRHFVLHPSGDTAGTACMSYVFPGEHGEIDTLPERSSLQRGIKAMMQRGDFIFWTAGAWI